MPTLRDAMTEVIHTTHCAVPGCKARHVEEMTADAILAMPEMRQIRRALQEHARMDQDYWHPDEERVAPSIREWIHS